MKKNIIGMMVLSIICVAGFSQSIPASTNSILIQAEDFTSYYDTSAGNYDLIYRQDVDVDMNYDHDPYWYEGIRVKAIQTGEELTYTIEVPAADTWDITFNGIINFNLYFDNSLYASNIGTPLDVRGDFRFNEDIVVPGVSLSAGTHTMTIISNSYNDFGDVQLDYIWFASVTDPPGPPPVAPKPYDDAAPPPIPADYESPVARYGSLYVDGPNIKSSVTGAIPRLRFVAISGSKWFPTIKNNTIYNLAYQEHVQGIRLAMYAEYGTYDDPYLRTYLEEKTLEVINECIDAGIYLEISYHTHATDFEINGDAYNVEMDFFNWLLSQPVVAAKPPNLIFGIINEIASSSISWNTAKPYAQSFVNVVRQVIPDNLILCGTPFWSQNPNDVIGNELSGNNIVYTFHMYTAEHQMSIADNIITCYDAGLPLWANEISPGHYDWTNWSYNFDNFNILIYMLESRGIPWSNWAWTIKGEALSAFYWHSQYWGPWKDSELTEGGKYIRDLINNNLTFTDFSEGADGWYLNDWEEPAADVEFLNEEVHIMYNGVASANNYGQQFSLENLRIVNGITYTISFDARAAYPRDIVVDVTENGDDYTTYGSSDSLTFNTSQSHYSFSFTMNDPTDNSARIVFNVGASIDDIWIDNIQIQYSDMAMPEKEKNDIVVLNENFADEIDWAFNPWQPSWPSATIDYTNNEAHITFQELAQDPWGQQLTKAIKLEQGASYVISFDAKSTAVRPLNVNIGNSVTYESYAGKDVVLSTNMAPYSFYFTMAEAVDGNSIIQFNLGTDINEIWLDNVRIKKYNRLLNGDFSLGDFGWNFSPWEPSWPSAEIEYAANEAHISFLELAPHDYGQQLSTSLKLEKGESYTVSFKARSLAPRPLRALITNNSYYHISDVMLSTTMKTYEFSFIMDAEASNDDIIRFDLGMDMNDIWLAHVMVRKTENLLKNGNFSFNAQYWSTGFYEGADGIAAVINGEYVISMQNSGTEKWHIQITQSPIELNNGKRYLVEFDARTDIARSIEINLGSGSFSNPTPYTSYSGAQQFDLTLEMQTYSFEFTMNQPDHNDARLEFNLGLYDSDVILDNIRILEIQDISDNFDTENDPGNWQSNGPNCFWNQIHCKHRTTIAAMDIQGKDGELRLTNGFDAFAAQVIVIDVTYYTAGYNCAKKNNWDLQYTFDGGLSWYTIFTWWDKKQQKILVSESFVLNAAEYNFSENSNFRFRSHGKNKSDDVFIDAVKISVYR